ncbi:putative lipoprotein [Paenibacillus sp. V4I5]|nr:putative lipoprotein [Paenibacillus sp. V4I5]
MKKVTSVALVAVLSIGTLAGCSTGKTDQEQATPSSVTTAAKKAATKFSISYPTTTNTGYHTRVDMTLTMTNG